jgi:hypothetical protein
MNNGWMDGRVARWVGDRMDGWMDGYADAQIPKKQ